MSDPRPPEVSAGFLEQYELVRELGRGGMGSVWLARQHRLKRLVAVKFVLGAGEMVSRLEREAKILAELTHPNLVGIIDSGLDEGRAYIVLEYVDGESLEQRLDRETRLPEASAIAIVEQVLAALAAIHERGILHRDLKPGNILLPRDGPAKLSDFGLARWTEKSGSFQTREGMVPGSPAFMAPELLLTGHATPATDLWALSVTLFKAIAGEPPFFTTDLHQLMGMILHRDPFEEGRFESAFSPPMRDFLATTLRKEPADRPADAASYRAALKRARFRSGSGVRATAARPEPAARAAVPTVLLEDPRRRPAAVAGAVLAALLAATLGGLCLSALRAPSAVTESPGRTVLPERRLPAPAEAAGEPRGPLRDLETIVRATSAVVRCATASPERLALQCGLEGAPQKLASAEASATTSHLLRATGLKPGQSYRFELRVPGASGAVRAAGRFATLSETPYWERPSYKSRVTPLHPLGRNPQGYDEFRNEADAAVMVLIPGAEFLMGDRGKKPDPRALPVHRVRVDTFLMDKLPVTRAQYKRFMDATGYMTHNLQDVTFKVWDNRPMVHMTWHGAADYCRWAGKRLPTEAEWELAAGGAFGRVYPWGDEKPVPGMTADWGERLPEEGTDARPAGSFPRVMSPYGLLDMGGGVRNWCADWYEESYYGKSPFRNPQGPAASLDLRRVERSCGFDSGNPDDLKIWHRFLKHNLFNYNRVTGFRGVKDL